MRRSFSSPTHHTIDELILKILKKIKIPEFKCIEAVTRCARSTSSFGRWLTTRRDAGATPRSPNDDGVLKV